MFSNYAPQPQLDNNRHNCNCHSPKDPPVINSTMPVIAEKDSLGNVIKLQWTPQARFTLNLTSDSFVNIYDGSKVLDDAGMTPHGTVESVGTYAYNTIDNKCWRYTGTQWEELADIAICNKSNTTALFSNPKGTTLINIKNFRGEIVYAVKNEGTIAALTVDDTLAQTLLQGFYNVDVYQVTNNATRHVRRIPLSIGYNLQPGPVIPPTINTPNHNCHSSNSGFATDHSLQLKNNVLSVNMAEDVTYGYQLPVTSGAVYEYAQPRTLVINLNSDNNTAEAGSRDIYEYILTGANAVCIFNGLYIPYRDGTSYYSNFRSLVLIDNEIRELQITVDEQAKFTIKENTYVPPAAGLQEIPPELIARIDSIDANIESNNDAVFSVKTQLEGIKANLGEVQVSTAVQQITNDIDLIEIGLGNTGTKLNEVDAAVKRNELDIAELEATRLTKAGVVTTVKEYLSGDVTIDGGDLDESDSV